MHKPRAFAAQLSQSLGHWPDQRARERPCQLALDTCGVGQGAQDVENRARAQFRTCWHHMFGGRVVHRGHHKADSGMVYGFFHNRGADHDVNAQLR